jgi:uncharacterized protein (TIRG00374 family)
MPTHKLIDRRQLIYLAILAIAVFLLVPRIIGFERVAQLLSNAEPIYLAIALGAETTRYFTSAGSTLALARLFDREVPFVPMTEAFFAGSALNRVFSTGGAPGMVARFVFLIKHQVTAGSVAAIFLIEDIIGLVIGGIVFIVGVTTLATNQPSDFLGNLVLGFLIGTVPLALASIYVFRNRTGVERIIHGLARLTDSIVKRLFHRSPYTYERVERSIDDFYLGLTAARNKPHLVAVSFGMNVLRYVGGGAALYFAFLSLHQTIAPGVLILLYTTTSLLTSTSAILGEVAIMGTGFAVLSLSLGITPEVAIFALILSRATAFWMPLPIGFLALLHLRRRHHL